MIIALNAPVPEYRATLKLLPLEKPLMRTRHYQQKKGPLFTGNQVLLILGVWVLFLLVSYAIVRVTPAHAETNQTWDDAQICQNLDLYVNGDDADVLAYCKDHD